MKMDILRGLFAFATINPLFSYAEVKFNGKYEQNFDSLTENAKFPDTKTPNFQADFDPMAGWQLAKIEGNEKSVVTLNVDTGTLGYGALYSYGHEGGADRSLGSISTASISTAFGLALVNSTNKTLKKVTVAFDAEIWRNPTREPTALVFAYGFSGAQINSENYLSSTDMIPNEELNVLGPVTGRDALPVDGKADFNRVKVKGSIDNLQWKPGETLFLRWSNLDGPGSGSGTAVDNLVILAD